MIFYQLDILVYKRNVFFVFLFIIISHFITLL